MKVCTICGLNKKDDEFSKNPNGKRGLSTYCRPCDTKERQRNRAANRERDMVGAARRRAAVLGLPFSITKDDIHIPTHCPALKFKLSWKGNRETSPSLDRIIPGLGYVKGNIAVISTRANRIKYNATTAELYAVADWSHEQEKNMT